MWLRRPLHPLQVFSLTQHHLGSGIAHVQIAHWAICASNFFSVSNFEGGMKQFYIPTVGHMHCLFRHHDPSADHSSDRFYKLWLISPCRHSFSLIHMIGGSESFSFLLLSISKRWSKKWVANQSTVPSPLPGGEELGILPSNRCGSGCTMLHHPYWYHGKVWNEW